MINDILYNQISFPESAKHFLKRPNVDTLINNAIKKPLTTVVAGAGYGKTQAVLTALESSDCNTVWVQLSELDNHINRFWERISHVFKPFGNSLSKCLETLGYPESIVAFDHFLHLLADELVHDKHYIFVFDDFHFINNKTIINFFELFISARIQNFSIVLISRKEPDLSLVAMMAKGLLARITEDDLRFTEEETKKYLQKRSSLFDEKLSSKIYSYTEGWILAIYLIGLSIEKGSINTENPILAAKIDIFNLIEKEIFSAASNKLQVFLIKLSKLDVVPSGLLNEIADYNYSLISDMMQLSLFIFYDAFSDSYRTHQIFADFLAEKECTVKEDEIIDMYLKAAEWYKRNDRRSEALVYYEKAGCYDEIFDIILTFTNYVAKETADLFIKLIEQAPEEVLDNMQIMRVKKAHLIFNNNQIAEATEELTKICNEYEALPKTEEAISILGEAYILLGLIYVVNQDHGFVELFRKADSYLPKGSKLVDRHLNIAEGLNVCSIKSPAAGEVKKHQDALFAVAPYASKVMNGCGYGLESLNAAESALYMGDLKSAEKHAYQAIYKSRQYYQYDIEYMANFVLVRIFTAKGKYLKIAELIKQMQNQLDTLQISGCLSLYDIIIGWFYAKIGETYKVPKWITHEEERQKILAPVILGREYLVRSDCLLAEERYYELLALMEQTDKMYKSRGVLYASIQNKITAAIVYHYMDNDKKSMEALNEAYVLTNPNGLIMQYVEYGNRMRTLIYNAKNSEACKIPTEWLDNIYTKSSTYAKQLTQTITAYNADHDQTQPQKINLSKREKEVLNYLYQGMTREEISISCYLSLSTVNSILKKIYNKLGAANSADAIRIAKEKEIL